MSMDVVWASLEPFTGGTCAITVEVVAGCKMFRTIVTAMVAFLSLLLIL